MLELIIGLLCCGLMAGSLAGYLKITKDKYYDGHDQSSLSNTFYKTRWKFRALLIFMVLCVIYPVLLADGIYTSSGWLYYAPYTLVAWSKFGYALCMGGILGVALCADYLNNEVKPHIASAAWVAAIGAAAGCCLRKEWYIGAAVWVAWLIYYLIKQYRNKKAGNPNAWGLYIELVAFYSVPTCLAIYMLMNYFFLAK